MRASADRRGSTQPIGEGPPTSAKSRADKGTHRATLRWALRGGATGALTGVRKTQLLAVVQLTAPR